MPPNDTRSAPAPAAPIPAPLRWAVRLLLAESAGLGLLTLLLIYENLTATANDVVSALLVTVFAAAGTAALALLGRALAACRSGARAPAIVLQLMLLPVGYYMITGGLGWVGVPLVALGLLVCGLLVTPKSTEALGAR